MGDRGHVSLDVFAQNESINRLYTPLTFAFPYDFYNKPWEEGNSRVEILKSGFKKLASSFPWIAGSVVHQDSTFMIDTARRTMNPSALHTMHADEDWPYNWDDVHRTGFPFSVLDERRLAQKGTRITEADLEHGLPVFPIQINVVPGGILLTFQAQHGAMDMTGLIQMIRLLAAACQGESFAPEEVRIGNMSRVDLIPLLSDAEYQEARRDTKSRSSKANSTQPASSPSVAGQLTWSYFRFEASTLAELKSEANQSVLSGAFVSTDDVLSALVWQAITRARLEGSRFPNHMNTALSRNVDVRKALDIPPTYPGLMVRSADHTCLVKALLVKSLGSIALELRSCLDPATLKQSARLAATQISRGDPSASHGASNPALDVRLSSWAKEQCYDLDFGFGKPVAVRRPAFTEGAREGLVYFLPKESNGDILVGICLGKQDMDRLRALDVMKSYAHYVG